MYFVLLDKPVITPRVFAPLNTCAGRSCPLKRGVTRYSLTAAPFAVAACHDTVACALPGTTLGLPTGNGAPIFTSAERAENLLHPAAFLAATLNVSAYPFLRPVIVSVVALEWNTKTPTVALLWYTPTSYCVIGAPPSEGLCHRTFARPLPGAMRTDLGGTGTVAAPAGSDAMATAETTNASATPHPLIFVVIFIDVIVRADPSPHMDQKRYKVDSPPSTASNWPVM